MKIGLNGATTIKASLEEDLRIADTLGYDYLEIWKEKLLKYLATHSLTELSDLFQQHKVKPYAINSIENITFRNEKDEIRLMEELKQLGEIAQAIHCPYIVVVPSNGIKDISYQQIHNETVRVLRKMADVILPYGVKLAFEFIGMQDFTVRTLEQTYEIIQDVNRDNVGLVIDTFHFYVGNSTIQTIEKIDQDKIFIFHINDSEDRPKDMLTDAHRLFPGLGVIPLKEIIKAIRSTGYNRMVSIELFRPEYWQMPPEEAARKAKAHTENLLATELSK